jgi:hypothetical protein
MCLYFHLCIFASFHIFIFSYCIFSKYIASA